MHDDSEPIADDEVLMRRISKKTGWYTPGQTPPVSPKAFKPGEQDTTGLSFFRRKFRTPESLAAAGRGGPYLILLIRAGDLRKTGVEVIPKPDPDAGPGHAEVPDLRAETRMQSIETQLRIASLTELKVVGPFPGSGASNA